MPHDIMTEHELTSNDTRCPVNACEAMDGYTSLLKFGPDVSLNCVVLFVDLITLIGVPLVNGVTDNLRLVGGRTRTNFIFTRLA
jgi:hypothetical protein